MFNVSLPAAAALAGSTPARSSPSPTVVATREANTAPSTDTPVVPPKERKKATAPLAAPTSRNGTEFCTTNTRFCMRSEERRVGNEGRSRCGPGDGEDGDET